MLLIIVIITIVFGVSGFVTAAIYWYIIKKDLANKPKETYNVQHFLPDNETIIF